MLATHGFICFSSLFLSLECFERLWQSFFLSTSFPCQRNFKQTPRVKLGTFKVKLLFMAPREFKSGGCRGSTYQATGQVWGLTAWLQTIINPLYNAQLAPRSAGVREGSCSNQRLLHTIEWKVSLSAPNPDPSSLLSMPFCYAECDCWFLLSPSFLNSGRAHLHPWVTHSFSQQTCIILLLGVQSMGECWQAHPCSCGRPDSQASWPHLYISWG